MLFGARIFDRHRELIWRIAIWMANLASSAFMLSFLLPEWRDYSEFERAVLELTPNRSSDDAFYALRDNAITPTFALRDHSAAVAVTSWAWIGFRRFLSPLRRMLTQRVVLAFMPFVIGLSLALGCIASLVAEFDRYAYPSWADTIMIPSVGALFVSVGLTLLLLFHVPILFAGSLIGAKVLGRILSAYLTAVHSIVGLVILLSTIAGWWFVLPACLLVAFFVYALRCQRDQFVVCRLGE